MAVPPNKLLNYFRIILNFRKFLYNVVSQQVYNTMVSIVSDEILSSGRA